MPLRCQVLGHSELTEVERQTEKKPANSPASWRIPDGRSMKHRARGETRRGKAIKQNISKRQPFEQEFLSI
jgi:hypothetical protein